MTESDDDKGTRLAHQENFDGFRAPKKSNTGKFILVGCLSVIIATMLLVGVGGIIAWQNWRGVAGNMFVAGADKIFEEIHLPDEEADALVQRARLLADEFVEKRITFEELQKLGEALADSDMMPMLISKAMYGGYIVPSGLSDEDKERGKIAFGRLARGAVEDKLVDDDFEAVLMPLSNRGGVSIVIDGDGANTNKDFQIKPPGQATAAELLQVIENAEKLAAEKELDPEPLDVDLVAEFDRLVEKTLGRKLAPEGG